jgi:AraC-like DNA-binding protein
VRYAGYLERGGWSIGQREVAGPVVPLIINFGDPFRIRMGASRPQHHRSFLAGLYDGYADVASVGRAGAPVRRLDWAGLAADWGDADQAHLIREFRAMAGVTPADYVRDAAGRFRALDTEAG